MNREYAKYLFDHLPIEQRRKILQSKIKGSIPGFRPGKLNSAPWFQVKSILKSNDHLQLSF